ncbi:MAG: UDP-N-acetylmuramoyl-L-alanyl-D-glutamate--2,6-diaminopimelate ligase [Anaerolineales bacterium]
MKLSELFADYPDPWSITFPIHDNQVYYLNQEVKHIISDSRNVTSGDLFVAIKGLSTNGHQFIPDAIERGAVAICGSEEISEINVPYIRVDDTRKALAYLSAALFGYPAKHLTVIGVTGTDGKTSTTTFIYNILQKAGVSSGMISTVNAKIGTQELDTGFHVTTPEAPQIQALLNMMLHHQPLPITHVVLETTSHGLAQKRVAACFYDVAVFTNITHEHLDFHGTYADYLAAKASLIDELEVTPKKPNGNYRTAVLNKDDNSYQMLSERIKKYPRLNEISYGIDHEANVKAIEIDTQSLTPRFKISSKHGSKKITLNLMGDYHIYNALAAWTATVEGLDIAPDAAAEGLMDVRSLPGRMEKIDLGQDFIALVDFAHTPNALYHALKNARRMGKKNVIAVFGSAGLRDKEKRWKMAEISVQLADISIFTAEDPRTEDIKQILREMKLGAEKGGGQENKNYFLIPDRREAIRFAVSIAKEGDLIILCGKGHEQSMCFGTIEYPWDDRVALQSAIAEKLGIPGPDMPYLPD